MKKLLLLLSALTLFAGCTVIRENIDTFQPNLNEEKTASTGDIFFEHMHENIWKSSFDNYKEAHLDNIDSFRFNLTVIELNDQKLGLQYSEYSRYGYSWLVKQGFNKRFDYAITDKVIRFKDYEFEILSIEKGQIKYKRSK